MSFRQFEKKLMWFQFKITMITNHWRLRTFTLKPSVWISNLKLSNFRNAISFQIKKSDQLSSIAATNGSFQIQGEFLAISKDCEKVWHKGRTFESVKWSGGKLPNIPWNFLNCRKRIVLLNGKASYWVSFQTLSFSLEIIDDHKIS